MSYFGFQIQHTCHTHVFFMSTQVTHIFIYAIIHNLHITFIFRYFLSKTTDFYGISIILGRIFTRIHTKHIFAYDFEQRTNKMMLIFEILGK